MTTTTDPPPDSPSWAKAKELFLTSLTTSSKKRPPQDSIDRFLREDFRLDKAISKCETLKHAAENQYSKSKSSRFVGKLLEVLVTVKEVADPFLEFAPESVSIAWSAVSFLIQVGASDLENCGLIAEACANIATVILNCRLYENRYSQSGSSDAGDKETEKEIMNAIPEVLSLVLDFSWLTQTRLGEHKILRSFKETFNPKLKEKYEELQEEYKKLRTIAGDAFQERVMDMMDQLHKHNSDLHNLLFPALEDIRSKLEDISDIKLILTESQIREQFLRNRASLSPTTTHEDQLNTILSPLSHETEHLCQWLFHDNYYLKWEANNPLAGRKPGEPDSTLQKDTAVTSQPSNPIVEEAEKPPRICYIKGRPGFGKSVTVACALTRLSKPERKSAVCYFFFRKGDDATQTARQAILSFASQMFSDKFVASRADMEKFNSVIDKIRHTAVDEMKDNSEGGGGFILSNTVVKKLVHEIGKVYGKPIYIVADAIDECVDHEIEELVPWFLELIHDPSSNFKFLFSSRDSLGLERYLGGEEIVVNIQAEKEAEGKVTEVADQDEGYHEGEGGDTASERSVSTSASSNARRLRDSVVLNVTEKTNSADMDAYLTSSLTKLVARRMVGTKSGRKGKVIDVSRMVAGIKKKANGMFTYSAMVVASLGQPSPLSLTERLKRLPDGMDELYRRRLESLTAEERKLVTLALKRIVFSLGDIGTVEIAEQFKQIYDGEVEEEAVEGEEGEEDSYDMISHTAGSNAGDDEEGHEQEQEDLETKEVEKEETAHLQIIAQNEDEPAISVISDSDSEADSEEPQWLWERSLKEAMNDPEVADTIYHLEQAGRDFFQFSAEKDSIDVIHKSVRDWVENESAKAAERDNNKVSLNSLFSWDEKTQSLKLSMPIPLGMMHQGSNNFVDFQSERDTHLDIAIYNLKVLNNRRFQELYMPDPDTYVMKKAYNEDEAQEVGEMNLEQENIDQPDSSAQAETGKQIEETAKRADVPVAESGEAAEQKDDPAAEANSTTGEPTGEDSKNKNEGEKENNNEEEAADTCAPDGASETGSSETEYAAGIFTQFGLMPTESKSNHRYEIVQWSQHLKKVEELFPPAERIGPKWDTLWAEVTKFFDLETFRLWTPHYQLIVSGRDASGIVDTEIKAIHLVAYWGHLMLMEHILDVMGVDPDERDDEGDTPLISAFGQPDMIELLLRHNVDVNIKGMQGRTCLQMVLSSAEFSSNEMDLQAPGVANLIRAAKLLIEAGSNVNDAEGMPKKKPPFFSAIAAGDLELFDLFMEHGVDVKQTDLNGAIALHKVFINSSTATKEDRAKMAEALIKAGADVNAEDIDSKMPLYIAVMYQNQRGVELLIENGADIHDTDLQGLNALHEAASPEEYENDEVGLAIVEALLAKGADLRAVTKSGSTPVTFALYYKRLAIFDRLMQKILEEDNGNNEYLLKLNVDGENMLHQAAQIDYWDIGLEAAKTYCKYFSKEQIKQLLETKEPDYMREPLLTAADQDKMELVKYYMELGADVHAQGYLNKNVLYLLFEAWMVRTLDLQVFDDVAMREEMMISLITSHPELLKDNGLEYLQGAIAKRAESVTKALLEAGVDIMAEDELGWNGLDHALATGITPEDCPNIPAAQAALKEYMDSVYPNKNFPSPSRMSATKKSDYITLSDDGLSFSEPVPPDEFFEDAPAAATIYSNVPVSPKANLFYYEVTLTITKPEESLVAIGLAADPCLANRLPGLPESRALGYAWHGDDELLYYSKNIFHYWIDKYETSVFKTGDIIGCGWNKVIKEIFYTKNGKYLGMAWNNVPEDKLWVAVGAKVLFEAKVNFGAEPFAWKGLEEMQAEADRGIQLH